MRTKLPASVLFLSLVGLTLLGGCGRSVSAQDRQRLSRAWAYFLYAQADAQLDRLSLRRKASIQEEFARNSVVHGLREPELKVVRESEGIGGSIGFSFHPTFELSGNWSRVLEENPHKAVADTMIQIFQDCPAKWDRREHLWHLAHDYQDDYNWARSEDRFKFPLAFYQDPYPDTAEAP